jgi:CheY-like chemotaxis protein
VADLRGLRVLIVDDNDVNRRMLHEQINSWKCATVVMRRRLRRSRRCARRGRREIRIQVVLLDYQMPEMDGAALAAAIKADPLLKRHAHDHADLGEPLG